jgi:hypothetical protein
MKTRKRNRNLQIVPVFSMTTSPASKYAKFIGKINSGSVYH